MAVSDTAALNDAGRVSVRDTSALRTADTAETDVS